MRKSECLLRALTDSLRLSHMMKAGFTVLIQNWAAVNTMKYPKLSISRGMFKLVFTKNVRDHAKIFPLIEAHQTLVI